jgi:hypothetical protein
MEDKWIVAYHYIDENNIYMRDFLEFYFENSAIEAYNNLKNRKDIVQVHFAKKINYIQ